MVAKAWIKHGPLLAKTFTNNYHLGIYYDNPSKIDDPSDSRSTIGVLVRGEEDLKKT